MIMDTYERLIRCCRRLVFVAAGVVVSLATFHADAGQAMHEFLLDGHVVANSSNIARSPVQAVKHGGNPVLTPDYNWETGPPYGGRPHLDRVTSPTIWVDEEAGKLRMLYWARTQEDETIRCAAESTDGVNWSRTMLDKYTYRGQETNIVIMDPPSPFWSTSSMWVYKNPKPELLPNSQYLGLIEFRLTSGSRQTYIVTSPDGLNWDLDNRHLVVNRKNDTHSSLVYCPEDGKFRAYIRRHLNPGAPYYRAVDVTESTDLVNWSSPTLLMKTEADEGGQYCSGGHCAPANQIYGLQVQALDGVYVAAMEMLRTETWEGTNGSRNVGPMDCELAYSRDSINWVRPFPDKPNIPDGPDGAWDNNMVYHNSGVIEWQGRWIVAYGGGPDTHGRTSPLSIGIAEFSRGRLIENSQDDPEQAAWIETKPLAMGGDSLLVNANLDGGLVKVGLLDGDGEPVEGYGADNCTLLAHDALRYRVAWPSNPALPEGNYRLHIEWDGGASLFAYELVSLIPGDANEDGVVTDADASILAAHWQMMEGATWVNGDFNGDGRVNDEDASILAAHWQEGTMPVPEPAVPVLMAGAGAAAAFWFRYRNRDRRSKP